MNVEIGTETPKFLFWEYLFRNVGILSLQCCLQYVSLLLYPAVDFSYYLTADWCVVSIQIQFSYSLLSCLHMSSVIYRYFIYFDVLLTVCYLRVYPAILPSVLWFLSSTNSGKTINCTPGSYRRLLILYSIYMKAPRNLSESQIYFLNLI